MKIKISSLWVFFLPIIFLTHLYKIMVYLFLLMSFHECMHIVCAYILHYEIESVVIYPFGLCASIRNFEYKNSWHEILITISGLSVHLLAAFFIPLFSSFLSSSFITYLIRANWTLFFFNLLPIYPLDGGRIIRNIFEFILPFRQAKWVSLCSSMCMFPVLLRYCMLTKLQIIVFLLLFCMRYFFLFLSFKEDVKTFYLYRYFHSINKKVKFHKHNDLYKNNTNCYLCNGMIISEKDKIEQWI